MSRLNKYITLVAITALLTVIALSIMSSAGAVITDGMTQSDGLGQIVNGEAVFNGVNIYANNGAGTPSAVGLKGPYGMDVDTVGHRLFIADRINNRVVVHTLNNNNNLIDHDADFVLGQSDFTTNSIGSGISGMYMPMDVAYDSTKNLLYVTDTNRILVFDVATISNGEDAVNVLGQPDFSAGSTSTTSTGVNGPSTLHIDKTGQLLYVTDTWNNRVLVYDVASITNGEAAVNVLGQPNFTTSTSGTTADKLSTPQGITLDKQNGLLFVGDKSNKRVSVFDVNTITNGENAVNVIGEPDFNTVSGGATAALIKQVNGLDFDATNGLLFVADTDNNRVLVFDTSDGITNGMNASNVLGQANFTSSNAGHGDGKLYNPVAALVDPLTGSIYVSETSSHRIRIFGNAVATPTTTTTTTTTTVLPTTTSPSTSTPSGSSGSGGTNSGNGYITGLPVNRVTPEVEDAGPNNGDANNDGIKDSIQDNVSSFVNPESKAFVVFESPSVCTNETTVIEVEPVKYVDKVYSYPGGLMNFTIKCNGTVGGYSTVKIIFYGMQKKSADFSGRKFINNNYQTLVGASVKDEKIGGRGAVSLTYSLQDGGPLDVDMKANGYIVDPAGIGTIDSALPMTGSNSINFVFTAVGLIVLGIGITIFVRRKRLGNV